MRPRQFSETQASQFVSAVQNTFSCCQSHVFWVGDGAAVVDGGGTEGVGGNRGALMHSKIASHRNWSSDAFEQTYPNTSTERFELMPKFDGYLKEPFSVV